MTKIKICGLTSTEDIEFVNELLPDFVGFVFAKSKRNIDYSKAKLLKGLLDSRIKAVGVFVNECIQEICKLEGVIDMVQLHGDEDAGYLKRLREVCKMPIIKAFRVGENFEANQVRANSADYYLFDTAFVARGASLNFSTSSNLTEDTTPVYGGTGEVFDWNKLSVDQKKLFFLAGGISVQNAKLAIETINPYCLDVSSSVETAGRKDFEKIKRLIDIVREEKNA